MTRRQLLRLLTAAPALAVTGCAAQPASSQQEKPLILRYAENQPEDYPTSKAARAFAELVAQRTDGRVKVLVYSGAELGADAVRRGGFFPRVSEPAGRVRAGAQCIAAALFVQRCPADVAGAGRQHRGRVSGHAGRDGFSRAFVVRRRRAQLLHSGKGDRAG